MNMIKKSKPPKRSEALKLYVADLGKAPVQRYAKVQKQRGRLISIGNIDVDVEHVVERTFLCDRHRCIQWTPHKDMNKKKALIDRSCCSHYTVPVTDLDRERVAEIMPLVRKRLDKQHPLVADPSEPPYEVQDDFSFAMRERDNGACQFVLYDGGLTSCAIHKTCLEEGLDPWVYKPLGCSLWPLAILDYEDDDGKDRLLLTIYARATEGLFESEPDGDSADESSFACLVDKDPEYDPMYRACKGVIVHTFGPEFYAKLDKAAQKHLAKEARS
jgi:uncharacterized protein DUF3109